MLVPAENVIPGRKEDAGRSCSSLCESVGKTCIAADLLFLNDCRALRQFFSCSRCEASAGVEQPALVTPKRGSKNSGACLFNSDVLRHPPSCEVAHADTQRLCACRLPLTAAAAVLRASTESPRRSQAPPRLAATAEAAGWKPGLRAEAYQGMQAAFTKVPQAAEAVDLSFTLLLVATGDSASTLKQTLQSVQAARGFSSSSLLVSLGCCGLEVEASRRMLEVEFQDVPLAVEDAPPGGLRGRTRFLAQSERDTGHLRAALQRALRAPKNRSLLVVHEGALLSPDALGFFGQLEPLLEEDPTIWCIGARNDAGLAPYVADVTALLRTDWHPARLAWLMRGELLQDLLTRWPEREWESFLRLDEERLGRQCVIPEVSRCHSVGPPPSIDDPALRRTERAAFDDFQRTIFWNQDLPFVHLGDLNRMKEASYDQLLLFDWPGEEGLAKSTRVLPRELPEISTGNYHLVLEDRHGSWSRVAAFFRLPSSKEMRIPTSYQGTLRLRWRGAVLHLLLWSSPLLAAAGIAPQEARRGQDFPLQPAILRAPVVSVLVGSAGSSCDATCEASASRCHDSDLLFLNGCGAIRQILGRESCGECLAAEGQEHPSAVLLDSRMSAEAPHFRPDFKGKSLLEQGPAPGSCLWSANLAEPPACSASHQQLARLCPCRPSPEVTPSPVTSPSTRVIFRDLAPISLVAEKLPPQRCGAAFGNRLGADCAAANMWCCSAGMWCGNSNEHCRSPDHECRGGASPHVFCGAGWTLRLPAFNLAPLAER
ncbi:unnamed protein product [Effrenium voratum]|nr:unnamed protein product [Effrenium voratum]